MIVADGIGIGVGVVLCKHIPERIIKWVSAGIFIVFGLVGVYEVLPSKIGLSDTVTVLVLLTAISLLLAALLNRKPNFIETRK